MYQAWCKTMQLIEMAPASWGGSHWVMTIVLEVGYCKFSIFHPGGTWRSKSVLWCAIQQIFYCLPGLLTLLSTVPLAYVLIRCGYFLTLRWIFLILQNVHILPCFPIAHSNFNYILLIAFHRWASSVFLSLPLVFKSCLHLFGCVCFSPASRSYFFPVK